MVYFCFDTELSAVSSICANLDLRYAPWKRPHLGNTAVLALQYLVSKESELPTVKRIEDTKALAMYTSSKAVTAAYCQMFIWPLYLMQSNSIISQSTVLRYVTPLLSNHERFL